MSEQKYTRLLRLIEEGDLSAVEPAFAEVLRREQWEVLAEIWSTPLVMSILSQTYRDLTNTSRPRDPNANEWDRQWNEIGFYPGYNFRQRPISDQRKVATLFRDRIRTWHPPVGGDYVPNWWIPFGDDYVNAARIFGDIVRMEALQDVDSVDFDYPVTGIESDNVLEARNILPLFYPATSGRVEGWPVAEYLVGVNARYRPWSEEDLEHGETFSDYEEELGYGAEDIFGSMDAALSVISNDIIPVGYLNNAEFTPTAITAHHFEDPDYYNVNMHREWDIEIYPLGRSEFHPENSGMLVKNRGYGVGRMNEREYGRTIRLARDFGDEKAARSALAEAAHRGHWVEFVEMYLVVYPNTETLEHSAPDTYLNQINNASWEVAQQPGFYAEPLDRSDWEKSWILDAVRARFFHQNGILPRHLRVPDLFVIPSREGYLGRDRYLHLEEATRRRDLLEGVIVWREDMMADDGELARWTIAHFPASLALGGQELSRVYMFRDDLTMEDVSTFPTRDIWSSAFYIASADIDVLEPWSTNHLEGPSADMWIRDLPEDSDYWELRANPEDNVFPEAYDGFSLLFNYLSDNIEQARDNSVALHRFDAEPLDLSNFRGLMEGDRSLLPFLVQIFGGENPLASPEWINADDATRAEQGWMGSYLYSWSPDQLLLHSYTLDPYRATIHLVDRVK